MKHFRLVAGIGLVVSWGLLAGCSKSSSSFSPYGTGAGGAFEAAGGQPAGAAPGSGGFISAGAQSNAGGTIFGFGGEVTTRDAGGACKGDMAAAEKIQLDLYVMVDQSLSMATPDANGMSRWAEVTGALQQFFQSMDSNGIGVGMQYFGLGLLGTSCNAPDYAMAEVEIAPLPGNLQPLLNSLMMHGPSSVTPTPAAVQGAIQHAQAWKMSHPSHAVAVLLVTDGEPDLCGLVPDVANAAMQGASGNPPIQTFVLGVGTALDALNQVAMAGGTTQAYLVTGTQNVTADVLAALNKIRAATALPCEFTLPTPEPGKPFDYTKVNVVFTPQGGAQEVVYYTADPSKCSPMSKAWHYDNPTTPTRIELCPDTCTAISMGGGTIGYQLYCPVISLPIE